MLHMFEIDIIQDAPVGCTYCNLIQSKPLTILFAAVLQQRTSCFYSPQGLVVRIVQYGQVIPHLKALDEQISNMLVSNQVVLQNRVNTSHDLARKRLVLLTIEQLVAIAKEWPQMIFVTSKIMSSLLCMFSMAQRPGKYFHNTEIQGTFCIWNHPHQVLNVHMPKKMECGKIKLIYRVTKLGVF